MNAPIETAGRHEESSQFHCGEDVKSMLLAGDRNDVFADAVLDFLVRHGDGES